jgi:hypothetical protein
MADLKPLGSEKLEGMDKIRRILEIAHYNEKPKSQLNENETLNYTIQLADGYTYGIVKEKLGYIIKKGINESVLDYSDPIRQRKYFDSYSQAMKKLNLHAKELNRIHENDEEIPLIGEQTASKKKFVLKTPKPATEPTPDAAPAPAPAPPAPESSPAPAPEETPAPPAPEEGGEPMGDEMMGGEPMGGEPMGDEMMGGEQMGGEPMGGEPMGGEPMGGEPMGGETEEGGGFKTIQRLTGKLSQKLRAYNNQDEDGLDSQDIKYVINMVLSALDLEKLDEDDKEDILSKFEEIDMYGDEGPESLDFSGEEDVNFGGEEFGGEPMGGAPMGGEEPMPQEPTENVFGESRVENVLKKYFVVTKEEAPILEEKKQKDYIKNKLTQIKVKQELQNLSETNRQLERANRLLSEGAQFVGKTNLDNLIFNKKGKQIKIDTRGNII